VESGPVRHDSDGLVDDRQGLVETPEPPQRFGVVLGERLFFG
jgi:hypothetical protein